MECTELVSRLLHDDVLIPLLVFTGIVVLVGLRTAASVIASVARERTRREIAAYIAEGSMTPDQGERLMKAGSEPRKCG